MIGGHTLKRGVCLAIHCTIFPFLVYKDVVYLSFSIVCVKKKKLWGGVIVSQMFLEISSDFSAVLLYEGCDHFILYGGFSLVFFFFFFFLVCFL